MSLGRQLGPTKEKNCYEIGVRPCITSDNLFGAKVKQRVHATKVLLQLLNRIQMSLGRQLVPMKMARLFKYKTRIFDIHNKNVQIY